MHAIARVRAFAVAAFVALVPAVSSAAAPLVPAMHGDFDSYTFAMTWQPGICSLADAALTGSPAPETCLPDQPHTPLIGLHGLWASQPQSQIDAKVPIGQWYGRGCDLYPQPDTPPALSRAVTAKLAAVMPHLARSLATHEWIKHGECFGFDPNLFFTTALAMRQAVADSPFGRYLIAQAGRSVTHAQVATAFETSFGTTDPRTAQLQCAKDPAGREVLTQIWVTVPAHALPQFPSAASLLAADQDSCPATFVIPSW